MVLDCLIDMIVMMFNLKIGELCLIFFKKHLKTHRLKGLCAFFL